MLRPASAPSTQSPWQSTMGPSFPRVARMASELGPVTTTYGRRMAFPLPLMTALRTIERSVVVTKREASFL